MKYLLSALALSLAACSPSAEQPPANQVESPAPEEKKPVPSLEGEWVVDQLNGGALDQTWPMTAEATAERFTIVSECHRLRYEMSQQGNIVKFTQVPGDDCARFKSPAEQLAEKSVKLANIAMFSDDGRTVQLSGPGGTVSMSRR
jgi:hypothetical protein